MEKRTHRGSSENQANKTRSSRGGQGRGGGRGGKSTRGPPAEQKQVQNQQSKFMNKFMFIVMNMIGNNVKVTVKGPLQYVGILHTVNPNDNLGVCLKIAYVLNNGKRDGPLLDSLVILGQNVLAISAFNLDFDEIKLTEDFKTDSKISGSGGDIMERKLEKWEPSEKENSDSLEGLDSQSHASANWDQFATNERLFGVTTDFNEDIYTTVLDKTGPDFAKKEANAARVANEITKMSTKNIHMAEERGHVVDNTGVDEEDRYSSVLRGPTPGKYQPPGQRKQGSQQQSQSRPPPTSEQSQPRPPPTFEQSQSRPPIKSYSEQSQSRPPIKSYSEQSQSKTPIKSYSEQSQSRPPIKSYSEVSSQKPRNTPPQYQQKPDAGQKQQQQAAPVVMDVDDSNISWADDIVEEPAPPKPAWSKPLNLNKKVEVPLSPKKPEAVPEKSFETAPPVQKKDSQPRPTTALRPPIVSGRKPDSKVDSIFSSHTNKDFPAPPQKEVSVGNTRPLPFNGMLGRDIAKRDGTLRSHSNTNEPSVQKAFSKFVVKEKEEKREHDQIRKKQNLKDLSSVIAGLKDFSSSFKLNTPVPQELKEIFAKSKSSTSIASVASSTTTKEDGKTTNTKGGQSSKPDSTATASKLNDSQKTPLKASNISATIDLSKSPATSAVHIDNTGASDTDTTVKLKLSNPSFRFNVKATAFKPKTVESSLSAPPLVVVEKVIFFGTKQLDKTPLSINEVYQSRFKNSTPLKNEEFSTTWPCGQNMPYRAQYPPIMSHMQQPQMIPMSFENGAPLPPQMFDPNVYPYQFPVQYGYPPPPRNMIRPGFAPPPQAPYGMPYGVPMYGGPPPGGMYARPMMYPGMQQGFDVSQQQQQQQHQVMGGGREMDAGQS